MASRSPHGERGLKSETNDGGNVSQCRSPHGERGLKCKWGSIPSHVKKSLSSRRAWIEIWKRSMLSTGAWSLSSRRAWIEIDGVSRSSLMAVCRSPHGERGLKYRSGRAARTAKTSLYSRRAWIEITPSAAPRHRSFVALLTESVD